MKYVDSNIFVYIALLPATDLKAVASKRMLEKALEEHDGAATSALTWDETVWAIRKINGKDIAVSEGEKLLMMPNLKMLDVKENTARLAQEYMNRYSLKPRDAIHAACCLENGIREMISDDADFDVVKEIKRVKLVHHE